MRLVRSAAAAMTQAEALMARFETEDPPQIVDVRAAYLAVLALDPDAPTRHLVNSQLDQLDLREQFLRCGIDSIDGVFWTHDHADHCHGIDDLRALRYGRSGPIPGYGVEETVRRLRARFSYWRRCNPLNPVEACAGN